MKVYTIVVTYNGEQCITKCLQSLRESTQPSEVILIDNASSDQTVSFVRTHFPEVRIITQYCNLGFGAANNIGMRMALNEGADYLFLLNQDAWVTPDCIAKLIESCEQHPEYGVVSPLQFFEESKLDRGFELYLNDGILQYGNFSDHQDVSFVNAAAWLLPARVCYKIGLFSPLFYHYGEDDNFCNRILFYKYKVVVNRNATAYHERNQTVNVGTNFFKYLVKKFSIKALVYFADPSKTYRESLNKIAHEVSTLDITGKLKGALYRSTLFASIIFYVAFKFVSIDRYKKLSLHENAFI